MSEYPTKHVNADFPGSVRLIIAMAWEVLKNIPRILKLASTYRRHPRPEEPVVILMGDNMDATHGISVSTERMTHELRAEGKDVHMVGVSHSLRLPGSRSEDGAVFMVHSSVYQDLFGYPGQELSFPSVTEICDLLEKHAVDIIEIESPGIFGLLVIAISPLLGITVVQNYRTDLVNYYHMLLKNPLFIGFLEWYTRSFLNCGVKIVVPSRAFQEDVTGFFELPRSRVVMLPRSVELSQFKPELADRRVWEKYGAPKEGPVVLVLGRVSREKCLETLIEAWPAVLEKHPDAILGVVGDGPFREEFQQRMARIGPAAFTGMITGDELPKLVASTSLLAFPSVTDTFGNAVLEALAAGVPAVVSDEGGPREIIDDGRCGGVMVKGRSVTALTDGINRLLDNPALREEMSRKARRRAEEYSPENAVISEWKFFRGLQAARRNRR